MPITIEIPTQQQLAQYKQDPGSLLAVYNAANTPKPAVGSTGAVTAAGATPGTPSNLNALSNPDWIKSMSEMISQLNIDAQQKANASRIPGATDIEKASSSNIKSALAGELPSGVYDQIARYGAERGVSTGSPMGANTNASVLKGVGLTALDMNKLGQDWTTAALGRNPSGPIANTQALVTTPAQAEALAIQRENMILDYNAAMAAINARKAMGSGGGGGSGYKLPSGSGGGTFAPATNWGTGITTPAAGWSDPGNPSNPNWWSDAEWNDLLYGDLPAATPPDNTYSNPVTNTSDYLPFGDPYGVNIQGGGINTGGMSQEELDWLYNVGG